MAARKSHAESNSIYGYRKVLEAIQEYQPELACVPETIRLIMQKEHLFSCVKRKFKNFYLGEESYYKHADNKLNRNFTATRPNEIWTADITYMKTYEGWLYLACVMDLFSHKVVWWSMNDTIS